MSLKRWICLLDINPTIAIVGNPPNGTVGQPYSFQFTGAGGTPPYTFALQSGAIPGLSLSASGLLNTGNPTTDDTYPISVQMTDALGESTTADFTIKIVAAPAPTLDYVFAVATTSSTLGVIDVSDLQALTVVATPAAGVTEPHGIAKDGDFLYVTGYVSDALVVWDVSTPTAPVERGSVAGMNGPQRLAVSGGYAYVAGGLSNRLHVVDISDPDAPSLATSLTGFNTPQYLIKEGDYLYITDDSGGWGGAIKTVDVSTPTSPSIVNTQGRIQTQNAAGMAAANGYLFLAGYSWDGLAIFDISTPSTPSYQGGVSNGSMNNAVDVAVSGDYAYVINQAGTNTRMTVVDISDPANPSWVTAFSDPSLNTATRILTFGDYAFISNALDPLVVVDISDPTSPVLVDAVSDASLDRLEDLAL